MKVNGGRSLLVLVFLLAACAGCDGETADTQTLGSEKRISLKVGYLPIADCAQLFVAVDQGFFQQNGLQVEPLVLGSGVKLIEALATEEIDIAYSAIAPVILARARGINLVAIAGGPAEGSENPEHAVLVLDKSDIETPKDLEGKRIAIVAHRSIDEPFVKEWLNAAGADVSRVTFLEVPFPQMEGVLRSGEVAAVATIEPFVTVSKQQGGVRVLGSHFVQVLPQTEIGAYSAREAWAKKNPQVVGAFRKAMAAATIHANNHPDDVRAAIAKRTKLSPTVLRQATLPKYVERLDPERLQEVMTLMVKWKVLEEPIAPGLVLFP